MRPPDLTGSGGFSTFANGANGSAQETNATGRQTLVFRKGATPEGIAFLRQAGFNVFVTNASDPHVVHEDEVGDANAIVFSTLGIALLDNEPELLAQLQNVASDSNSPILTIKPERVRRMIEVSTGPELSSPDVLISLGYLEGCRDAYARLVDKFRVNGGAQAQAAPDIRVAGFDESQTTWGLQATKVVDSPFLGRGVKVAVLDTGIDFTTDAQGKRKFHADFEGRKIVAESFVFGVSSPKDGNGHGTHCVGTACGPRQPSKLPGYGVASAAEIYIGKVLNDAGSGADGWIIAGIEWAINQGCRVISLSLGSEKNPGDTFNEAYEEVAKRALDAGAVIVAAAGNDSERPQVVRPVNGPADCPSIIAVAALDPDLGIASFSNGGINSDGGEVNVAAPGVRVHSSFLNSGHTRKSGTSMATPHVAGIAALFLEANPTLTARQLQDKLTNTARSLPLSNRDVGKGIVQAPQTVDQSGESPDRRVTPNLPPEEDLRVKIQQSSPITIGGGGSVGLDFDASHYQQNGGGSFASSQDRLSNCDVVHQNGKLLRNFHPEMDGKQCVVVIRCRDTITNEFSDIRIVGGPSGPLGIGFTELDFPPGAANQPLRFSATRKVVWVQVTNSVTGVSTDPFNVPDGWAGTIRINN